MEKKDNKELKKQKKSKNVEKTIVVKTPITEGLGTRLSKAKEPYSIVDDDVNIKILDNKTLKKVRRPCFIAELWRYDCWS